MPRKKKTIKNDKDLQNNTINDSCEDSQNNIINDSYAYS